MIIDANTINIIMDALSVGTVSGVLNGLLNNQAVRRFLSSIPFDECLTESGNFVPQMQFGSVLTVSTGSSLSSTEVIQL